MSFENFIDHPAVRRNSILRKGAAFAHRPMRAIKNCLSSQADFESNPPIVVNSLPKSGTHLALQITRKLPNVKYYGHFIANSPSLTLHERSPNSIARRVRSLLPNETIGAHIHYSPTVKSALRSVNALSIFIYRDPRAVLVSEVFYLTEMNRFHRMHKHFAKINNLDDRLKLALEGLDKRYPSAPERFLPYAPWLEDGETLALKYEDLIGSAREKNIAKIGNLWRTLSEASLPYHSDLEKTLLEAVDPAKSHTFREGGTDRWRKRLSAKQVDLVTEKLRPVLERFGYAP